MKRKEREAFVFLLLNKFFFTSPKKVSKSLPNVCWQWWMCLVWRAPKCNTGCRVGANNAGPKHARSKTRTILIAIATAEQPAILPTMTLAMVVVCWAATIWRRRTVGLAASRAATTTTTTTMLRWWDETKSFRRAPMTMSLMHMQPHDGWCRRHCHRTPEPTLPRRSLLPTKHRRHHRRHEPHESANKRATPEHARAPLVAKQTNRTRKPLKCWHQAPSCPNHRRSLSLAAASVSRRATSARHHHQTASLRSI